MKHIVFICVVVASMFGADYTLEIYKNKTIFHQNFAEQTSSFKTKIPKEVLYDEIGISSPCFVKKMDLSEPKALKESELKTHQARLDTLRAKLASLNESLKYLQRHSSANSNTLKGDLENFSSLYEQNFAKLTATQKELDEQNLLLSRLKYIKDLNVTFGCDPKFVKLSYPVVTSYSELKNSVSADIKEKKVLIKQSLELENPFDYELKNLDIALYPFSYTSSINLPPFDPPFNPLYVEGMGGMQRASSMSLEKSAMYEEKSQAEQSQNTLANMWSIKGVNLAANQKEIFVYDKQDLDAKFDLIIDGYGAANAYIRATVKPKFSVESAMSEFYVDGIRIGKTVNERMNPDEKSYIFFGKNSLIDVKKEKITDFTKETFFQGNAQRTEKWLYTIKNNSNTKWNIILKESLPISTHESVKVVNKTKLKESELLASGEISYEFELNPNESKKFEFEYEVTKPR